MTPLDVERAIGIIEAARLTHVQWRDYWLAIGDNADDCTCGRDHAEEAETAGDLAHQEWYIENYDHVLNVLRAQYGETAERDA